MLVNDLLMESGGWDWNKINNVLWEFDRWEVNKLLGGSKFGEDNLIWNYTSKGVYSVRLGYYVASQREESSSNDLTCGFKTGLR